MDKSLVRFMAGICCMILMVAGGGMMRPQPVYATPFAFATVNDVYRQDFNTLVATGTSNWRDDDEPDTTIAGWYSTTSSYAASAGNSMIANLYSYGTTASDRALGSLATGGGSGTGTIIYGVVLTNNTGQSVNYVAVSYYGEQWRDADRANQTLAFSYVTGTNLSYTNLFESGTNVTQLNFVSPISNNNNIALDGNATANRTLKTFVIPLGTALANGRQIMLRWTDATNGSGPTSNSSHALAIDDLAVKLSLTPTAVNWAQSSLNVNKTSVKAGDTFMYTLKVADAEGGAYTVTDTMPDYLTILSAPNMTITGQTVSASGTLPPNIPATYQITVQVQHNYVGMISNSALVTDGTVGRELFAPDVQSLHGLYLPLITN